MFSKKIILVLVLLAYLANIATGSAYRRRESRPRGLSVSNVHSSMPTATDQNGKPEEVKNEYAIIHEARKSRHMSRSHKRPNRSKGYSTRISSPFIGQSKPLHSELSSYKSFSSSNLPKPKSFNPERRAKISSWRKAPGQLPKTSDFSNQHEPDYVY